MNSENDKKLKILINKLNEIHENIKRENIEICELRDAYKKSIKYKNNVGFCKYFSLIGISLTLCIVFIILNVKLYAVISSIRCLLPNNYLIWEATRPISNCEYCIGINKPIFLPNISREEFMSYAYLSRPIIIKKSISHWPASTKINYDFIRKLYNKNPDALNNFKDECQFLHFKSNFLTLNDVFEMPIERAQFGKHPWYVGFSNCNPSVLKEIRKYYPKPHFLPEDAEIPNTDYIFLGYDQGAVMHLDYIPRLMWQAQLKGKKKWLLAPVPECDDKCSSFSFFVEPGDAILLDTRLWYHATFIPKGNFSLTIQSEYG